MEITKHQHRAVEQLHVGLTIAMSEHYAEYVGRVVDTDIAFTDHTTYGEFIDSLSNPSCSYTCTLAPLGPAVIDYSLPVAGGLLNYALGSKPGEKLTAEEMSAMGKILTKDAAAIEAVWEPVAKVEAADAELETNPELMEITGRNEYLILVAFEINGPDFSGLISLAYPDTTLESLMPKLETIGEGLD